MKALLALLILAAAALAGAPNLAFAAPDIVVRESANPAKGVVTGQRVAIYIDVLFRDAMAHPPRVEIPDVRGAQIFRFETQGSTMRETIDAASYVGQRFEFAFYARRAGDFTIPPAEVTLLDREGATAGSAKGAALTIGVATPPGVSASEPILATESMNLEQSWSPDPKGPHKPGDAIVRTLIRTAENVPALAFADPPLDAPEGVRAYAAPPEAQDSVNRGALTGKRIDRITYVFEQAGSYRLPAFRQPWWDLAQHQARAAEAAGVSLDVEAPLVAPAPASKTRARWAWVAAGVALMLALYLVSRVLRRPPDPETLAYRALTKACATADAAATYRCFAAWRDQLPPDMRAKANQAASPLQQAVFGSRGSWRQGDGRQVLKQTNAIRHEHRRPSRFPRLPPLNPPANTAKRWPAGCAAASSEVDLSVASVRLLPLTRRVRLDQVSEDENDDED